jgi:hypothetical protein
MPEASKYQCAIAPIGVQRFAIFIIACFLPSPRAKPAQPAASPGGWKPQWLSSAFYEGGPSSA